jgi:hypothetical protein
MLPRPEFLRSRKRARRREAIVSTDAKAALRALLDVLADARIARLAGACRSLGTRAPRELLNAMRDPDRANRPSAVQAEEIATYARALAERISSAATDLSSSVRILALSPATPTAVSSALPAPFAVPPSAESPLMSMSVRDVDQLIASIDQQLAAARAAYEESASAMQADGSNPRRAELREQIAGLEERLENARAARVVAQRREAELRAEQERQRRAEAHSGACALHAEGLGVVAELETTVTRLLELFAQAHDLEDRAVRLLSRHLPRRPDGTVQGSFSLNHMLTDELHRLEVHLRSADGPGDQHLGMTSAARKRSARFLARVRDAMGLAEEPLTGASLT